MKKLLIIGGNGHGSVIASCVNDNRYRYGDDEWDLVGFVNDYETNIDKYPVIGGTNDIEKLVKQDYYFAWGIHLIGKNNLTDQTFQRMNIPSERLATIIHKTAFIGEDVIIEPGVLIMPNTYIANRTHIGMCTMIKANACIGHDVECGRLCHFAMNSVTGSFCKIGICSDVAISATILEHKHIGNYAMAGAASLVTHDIHDNEIHIGSPAKFMRRMNNDISACCKSSGCIKVGGGKSVILFFDKFNIAV